MGFFRRVLGLHEESGLRLHQEQAGVSLGEGWGFFRSRLGFNSGVGWGFFRIHLKI